MKRTKTLQNLADSLAEMCFGRTLSEVHKKRICIQCGKKIGNFTDDESRMEYEISGLGICCQKEYFDEN